MKVLIPLGIGSKWDDNELRYCLRSLEKNALDDSLDIHIYGTIKPKWLTGVKFIETERYYPKRLKSQFKNNLDFENYFDVLNKVREFTFNNLGMFTYMYDDILLIKPTYLKNITNVPLEKEEEYFGNIRKKTQKHLLTINRSIFLAKNSGINNLYCYETHLPRLYNGTNISYIFKILPLEDEVIPYALATLYFNTNKWESGTTPLSEHNDIQARFSFEDGVGCFDSNTTIEIESAVIGKTWVNYNDKALFSKDSTGDTPLMSWIEKKFSNKSKYEL